VSCLWDSYNPQKCGTSISTTFYVVGLLSSSSRRRGTHGHASPSCFQKYPSFPMMQRRDSSSVFGAKRVVDSSPEPPFLGAEEESSDDKAYASASVEIGIYNTKEVLEKLWSYVNNLQRARKMGDTKPASSLARYMEQHPVLLLDEDASQLQEVVERAMVQALRKAGESNDYRLILRLVSASIAFANDHPILKPRIFGEALDGLCQTQANVAKLKSVWNLMTTTTSTAATNSTRQKLPSFLESPPTAYELNVLLKSLASRGKSRACVDVFKQHVDHPHPTLRSNYTSPLIHIRPDAYTISTLFTILTDSISSDQKLCDPVAFSNTIEDALISPASSTTAAPLHDKLASLTFSTCWQWNSVIEILGLLGKEDDKSGARRTHHNNHVYSSLLKLQVKAQELFVGHRNGPQLTMAILDDMMQNDVIPDVVTCTLAIKAMSQAGNEKEGTTTTKNLAVDFLKKMKTHPKLPSPNQYSYSAAIMACAKLNDHQTALDLLEEMRQSCFAPKSGDDSSVQPNTWVYNTALLALDEKPIHSRALWPSREIKRMKRNRQSQKRHATEIGLSLLDQMKSDHTQLGFDTFPDTVTYNTILSVGSFSHQTTTTPLKLIHEMKFNGIARDAFTYRTAVMASTDVRDVQAILQETLDDEDFLGMVRRRKEEGDLTAVFNAGLFFFSTSGDFLRLQKTLALMVEREVQSDDETVTALIKAVGKSGQAVLLKNLVVFLGDKSEGKEKSSRGFSATSKEHSGNSGGEEGDIGDAVLQFVRLVKENAEYLPPLNESHYSQAIEVCLGLRDFTNARSILSQMRSYGRRPTARCMESFATAYAKSAINPPQKSTSENAASWADNAYKIAMALVSPQPSSVGTVARACAVTGRWKQARTLLKMIHGRVLSSRNNYAGISSEKELESVRRTQSLLLGECSRQGNLKAALFYTNDIQDFASKYSSNEQVDQRIGSWSGLTEIHLDEDDIFVDLRKVTEVTGSRTSVGMHPQDWMSLIQAASKAGDWMVSFNALQFLRPYVKRTKATSRSNETDTTIDQRYEQLTPALTAVVRCLESHSQQAWAIRSIEDWIEWSGRKPRAEAVLSAIRVLSSTGYGDEVKRLLDECVREDLGFCFTKKGVGYEEMLYIGAVTSLHNNGLYDEADEVFMAGVSAGYLPFYFSAEENGDNVLDLHGLNVALAHSAVRVAMRQHAAAFEENGSTDMMIITGRGRNSAFRLRPILRPEVQRMLLEEFYPPLNTLSVPGNIGALKVLGHDIDAWQNYQQEQKGARMLELADLLRNLSCQDRLKKSIALSVKAIENDDTQNSKG